MLGPRKVPTMSVVVQVGELVAPLCYYAERILNEGDNDQEASNCGQIPIQPPLAFCRRPNCALELQSRRPGSTHGFTGSDTVSNQSSILLVCSRSWSSGLGSLVVPSLRPAPPKGL